MGVNVQDILSLPTLEGAIVHAGEDQVHESDVEWASVMEAPVENFYRKHEIILTTGAGCHQQSKSFEGFVQDIIDSGASALVVATGQYILNISDQVKEMARDQQFIILEISGNIRFSHIIHDILAKVNQFNDEKRAQSEALRQHLTNEVLNGGSLQELVKILYDAIKIPIAISDSRQQVRANYDFDDTIIDALNGFNDLEIEKITDKSLIVSDHPLYHHVNKYKINNSTCYELVIYSNGKKQGYLLFMPSETGLLDWFTMHALEHGLTAFALFFLTENAVELTEIRLKDNFVLSLAKDVTNLDGKWLSKGELLGYDLSLAYVCIVGDFQKGGGRDEFERTEDQSNQSSLHSLNYYVQKEITNASHHLNRKTLSSFDGGEIIVFLEVDEGSYRDTVNHFLDMVERRIHAQLSTFDFAWGIGFAKQGFNSFYDSYHQARTALNIKTEQHGFGARTFFEATRINRLLMQLNQHEEINELVSETVTPLVNYDFKRQTNLMETFMTYQQFKGNVSQTARALNLHRQSLLYRLRNIENLTNLTLVNADDSFLLELSVRLYKLQRIE